MLTWKTKAVLSEDGKHTRLQVKKCGFQMQVSVAFHRFARIGDDKILLVLSLKTIQVMEFNE
jgi:hypothetical protein